MAGIRGLLIDLDGVIYTGDRPITGAAETISWLQAEGYPFRFVSNSTRRSVRGIAEKLAAMGIPAGPGMIVTPAVAAAALARQRGWSRVFPVTTAEVAEDFRAAGIEPCGDSCDFIAVGDCGDSLTYSLLNRAFRLALDGVPILALEKDRFFRDSDGLSLSAGPFVAALEYATGRQAELVGKPSPQYFLGALSAIGIPPGEAAMVGDDPVSDVQGAMEAGMAGILVLTGKSSSGVLASIRKPPTAVLPSIAALPGYLSGLEEG
ncbi:MAG: HAD-IIA family hydrolase [Methanolinea sp.]|nr:HAD-IIA family hydrolase [Methanolinea sp.]